MDYLENYFPSFLKVRLELRFNYSPTLPWVRFRVKVRVSFVLAIENNKRGGGFNNPPTLPWVSLEQRLGCVLFYAYGISETVSLIDPS